MINIPQEIVDQMVEYMTELKIDGSVNYVQQTQQKWPEYSIEEVRKIALAVNSKLGLQGRYSKEETEHVMAYMMKMKLKGYFNYKQMTYKKFAHIPIGTINSWATLLRTQMANEYDYNKKDLKDIVLTKLIKYNKELETTDKEGAARMLDRIQKLTKLEEVTIEENKDWLVDYETTIEPPIDHEDPII